jgi:putative ATP-dependent endonuclease of OLD family
MKLREISWRNYRRMPDGKIDVRNHLVLVGPNDTGKSSIVRILELCLGIPHNHLPASVTERDFTDGSQPMVVAVTLSDITDTDRAAFPDEIAVEAPERLVIQVEAHLDPTDSDQRTVRRTCPDAGHGRGPNAEQLATIGFEAVSAVRSLLRELSSGTGGAMRTLLKGIDLSMDGPALANAASAYREALDNSQAIGGFRSELASALSGSLPRTVTDAEVRLKQEADLLDDPLSGVSVTVRDGDQDVRLVDQSDGIRALSVLTLMGMSLKTAHILAVDEPENHLHPIAQRTMARRLREGVAQTVVVTHSPSVVAMMDPLDIVALRTDRRPRQLPAQAPAAQQVQAVRHWAGALIEPITARRVVLVEGPADRILFRRASELIGVDLDRIGVAVFELHSADFFPFAYSLLGPAGFDLPTTGLVDSDGAPKWAATIGVSETDLHTRGFDVSDPDLEGMYVNALGADTVTSILLTAGVASETSIVRSCGIGAVADLTPELLANYCRKKRKVPAAVAVAAALSRAQVEAMPPLLRATQRVT